MNCRQLSRTLSEGSNGSNGGGCNHQVDAIRMSVFLFLRSKQTVSKSVYRDFRDNVGF
jgi:hypothetical protein